MQDTDGNAPQDARFFRLFKNPSNRITVADGVENLVGGSGIHPAFENRDNRARLF